MSEDKRPWICFHCGFETTDETEAQAHFGERDDAEEFTPTCQWWKRIPDGERAQAYQQLLQELEGERRRNHALQTSNEGLEYQVNPQQGAIQSYKPFRQCRSINEVFFVYDSMEGRALAAEEQVKHWEEKIRSTGYDGADEIVEALKAVRVHLDEKTKELRSLADDMTLIVTQRDDAIAQRHQLSKALHEREMATWKNVCDSEVFQDLKHGRFRDILLLLKDGEISVGKAAESIIERANGLEPRLPGRDMLIPDDATWREVADELKWVLSRMTRFFDEGLRPRDSDSPAQQLVDEAKALLVGYDEDAETERRAANRSGVNKWAKPLTAEIVNNPNFGQ